MILFFEFMVDPRHVLGWPARVEVDAAAYVVRTVRFTPAFGFMLKGAQLRLFVIDGVKNRPSKVAGLRLTLVVNGSPSEVGGKQVSIACTFKGRSKMTTWGSVACVQTIR